MDLVQLDPKTIEVIYHEHIVKDFPIAEIRPLKNMIQLYRKHHYIGYGLYHNQNLVGYAFFAGNKKEKVILLDYFAVVEKERNSGYGSQFLKLLKEEMKDCLIIAEVESVESTSILQEKQLRQRRIHFYLRNGFIKSSLTCRLFGVHYNLLYLFNHSVDDASLYKYIKEVYHSIFNPLIFKIFIKLKRDVK